MRLKRVDFIAQVKMVGISDTAYGATSTREGRPWLDIEFDLQTVSIRWSKDYLERTHNSTNGMGDTLYVPVSNVKFYTLEDGEVHPHATVLAPVAEPKRGPGRPPKILGS